MKPTPRLRVAVLGAGSWGTALAAAASRRQPTVLWARDPAQAADMAARHENARYLPGIALPQTLTLSSDLDATLRSLKQDGAAGLIILGVPVAGLAATCAELAHRLPALGLRVYRGGNAHREDEWVQGSSLTQGLKLLRRVVELYQQRPLA